jgi:hypothetical protein
MRPAGSSAWMVGSAVQPTAAALSNVCVACYRNTLHHWETAEAFLRHHMFLLFLLLRLLSARFFKDVDELTIPPSNLIDGGFARSSLRPESDEGFPEVGVPDGEADEAWHGSRNC